MPLFDDFERTNSSPASYAETSFTFLNRVATPFWSEVRRVLEAWFSRYPSEHATELRENFRSSRPGQHFGAWWELYLHELFLRLDYGITVHPDLPHTTKRPDFELRRDGRRLYVEAAVVFSGIREEGRDSAREGWILDAVNQAKNPNFFVRLVEFEQVGTQRPKESEVTRPLEEWLSGLDPDEVKSAYETGDGLPQLTITPRDWKAVLEAFPVKPEARGKPDHRLLGGGPMSAGWVDDIQQFRSTLKAKAGRYGLLNDPFVIAVCCESAFMEEQDIEQALFGRLAIQFEVGGDYDARTVRQRDGTWMHETGSKNTRVSGVLTAVNLNPWNAPDRVPHLWINPWASHPLQEDWPFPQTTANDRGEVAHTPAEPDMNNLLGLPVGWPGSRPFP